jgi:hypothetical protein
MAEVGSRKPTRVALIGLMVLGALMLWVGNPVIWLWLGSQVTSSQQPGFGPYMLVGTGILVSTVIVAMLLARIDRRYRSITGQTPTVRMRLPWLRSLRDEREPAREITVLDLIMVLTAITAIAVAGVWFLLFAGSPLPGG